MSIAHGIYEEYQPEKRHPVTTAEIAHMKFSPSDGLIQTDLNKTSDQDGPFYFNLKATHGQVILKRAMYSSVAAMENGRASIKKSDRMQLAMI